MFLSPGSRAKKRLAATKAEQQAAKNSLLGVTPLHQQDHPSSVKAWVNFTPAATPVINGSYNATVTRNGTGDHVINWTPVPFASAGYVVSYFTVQAAGTSGVFASITNMTASSARIISFNLAGVTTDATNVLIIAAGTQ